MRKNLKNVVHENNASDLFWLFMAVTHPKHIDRRWQILPFNELARKAPGVMAERRGLLPEKPENRSPQSNVGRSICPSQHTGVICRPVD